jgi:type IV pilus assembly protein PilV
MKNLTRNGFTLVEVLVSVFVLAVGIIGAAGMQLAAARMAQQSAFQTVAIQLASDMADKMRKNAGRFDLDDDANPFLNLDYSSLTDVLPPVRKTCHADSCTTNELAAFEIHEWKSRVKAALPGGRVRICRDVRPWNDGTGAFRWSCTAPAAGGDSSALVIKIGWHGKGATPDGRTTGDANAMYPPNLALTVVPYSR